MSLEIQWYLVECRRTFDSGIVFVHEVALNELDRQSRLANTCPRTRYVRPPVFSSHSYGFGLTTTTNYNEFILSQELGLSMIPVSQNNRELEPTKWEKSRDTPWTCLHLNERRTRRSVARGGGEGLGGKREGGDGVIDCVLLQSKAAKDNTLNKQPSTSTLTQPKSRENPA